MNWLTGLVHAWDQLLLHIHFNFVPFCLFVSFFFFFNNFTLSSFLRGEVDHDRCLKSDLGVLIGGVALITSQLVCLRSEDGGLSQLTTCVCSLCLGCRVWRTAALEWSGVFFSIGFCHYYSNLFWFLVVWFCFFFFYCFNFHSLTVGIVVEVV